MSASPFIVGHVGLNVSDLSRSMSFYQQAFGLRVVSETHEGERHYAMLSDDGKIMLTLWQQSQGSFSKSLPGLHHLAFRVESIDEVQQVEQRLRSMSAHFLYDGIVPHQEGVASGGIFFEDPDGIRLEVYSPTGAEHLHTQSDGPSCGLF